VYVVDEDDEDETVKVCSIVRMVSSYHAEPVLDN
jgi:hypothetical protein